MSTSFVYGYKITVDKNKAIASYTVLAASTGCFTVCHLVGFGRKLTKGDKLVARKLELCVIKLNQIFKGFWQQYYGKSEVTSSI